MSTDKSREKPQAILVGEVLKAYGIRGEVAVKTFTENPNRFREGAILMVGASSKKAQPTRINSVRPDARFNDRLLVGFEGIHDRASAERLHGSLIFVEPSELPDTDEDAYWEHELVGAEVFDVDGERRGTIAAIHAREEQDLWEVATESGSVFVPAAKDLVVSVDAGAGRVVINPPEGLFDAI